MTSLEAENPSVYAGFRSLPLARKIGIYGQFDVGGKKLGSISNYWHSVLAHAYFKHKKLTG